MHSAAIKRVSGTHTAGHAPWTMGTAASSRVNGASETASRNGSVTGKNKERSATAPPGTTSAPSITSVPEGTRSAQHLPAEAIIGGRTNSNESADELLESECAVASVPAGTALEEQPPAEATVAGQPSSNDIGFELPVAPAGTDAATHHERQEPQPVQHLSSLETASQPPSTWSSPGTSSTDSLLPDPFYPLESSQQSDTQEQRKSTLDLPPLLGAQRNALSLPELIDESASQSFNSEEHVESRVQESERLECEPNCFSQPPSSGSTAAADNAEKLPEFPAVGRRSAGHSPDSAVNGSTEAQITSSSPPQSDKQDKISKEHAGAYESLILLQDALGQQSGRPSTRSQQDEMPVLSNFFHAHGTAARDHECAEAQSSSPGMVPTSAQVGEMLEAAAVAQEVHLVESMLPQDPLLEANPIRVTSGITEASYSTAVQLLQRLSLDPSDSLDFSLLNRVLRSIDGSSEEEDERVEPPVRVALVTGEMTMMHHVRCLREQVGLFLEHVQSFSLHLRLFSSLVEARPSRGDCCPQQGWTCEHLVHVFSQVVERFTYMEAIFSREIADHPNHKKTSRAWFTARDAFTQPETQPSPRKKSKLPLLIVDDGLPTPASSAASGNRIPTSRARDTVNPQVPKPDTEESRGIAKVDANGDSAYGSQKPSPETEAPPPSDEVQLPVRRSEATSRAQRPRSADAALLLAEELEQHEDNAQPSSQGPSQRGTFSRFFRTFSTRGRQSGEKRRHSAHEPPRDESE